MPTCVRPTRGRGSFCEVHSPGGGGAHRVWPRTLVEPSLPPSLPRGHAIHSCQTICRAHGPPTILLCWHTSILDGIHILFESTETKLCGVCSQLRLRCWIGVPARERRGGSCCWHLSSRRWRPLDAARGRACAPPRRVAVSCPRSSTAVRGGSSLLYLPVRAYQWPHVHAPPSVGRGPTRATSDTQLPFRYITCRLAWLSSDATSFYALLHLETRHSVFFSFLRR